MTANDAPIEVLVARLDRADELETAERVATARGLTVPELLARRPPHTPLSSAIVDLYELLRAKGYSFPRIGFLCGRSHPSICHSLRYRRDPTFRAIRAQRAKLTGTGGPA